MQDYTHSEEQLAQSLQQLEPGDGGAAILDTISYGVDLLEDQPKEYRRVLLLISEERDHGSKHTKAAQLVSKIGRSDVLVLSISYSPSKAELAHDIKDNGEDRALNMVSTLVMAVQAFKKNVAKQIAIMSGGEYTTFTGDRHFEARVMEAAKDVRNRYLITFSPSDPTPGLHTIRVHTVEDYGARIIARANYWRMRGSELAKSRRRCRACGVCEIPLMRRKAPHEWGTHAQLGQEAKSRSFVPLTPSR